MAPRPACVHRLASRQNRPQRAPTPARHLSPAIGVAVIAVIVAHVQHVPGAARATVRDGHKCPSSAWRGRRVGRRRRRRATSIGPGGGGRRWRAVVASPAGGSKRSCMLPPCRTRTREGQAGAVAAMRERRLSTGHRSSQAATGRGLHSGSVEGRAGHLLVDLAYSACTGFAEAGGAPGWRRAFFFVCVLRLRDDLQTLVSPARKYRVPPAH